MGDYLPVYTPGNAVTFTAGADVTGGQLLAVTGPYTVEPTTDDTPGVWVAGYDAKAGEQVTCYRGGVQKLIASAAIPAASRVAAAADGRAAAGADGNVGTALTTAAAAGDPVEVALDR